jgi:hypothetical protein
MAIGRGCGSVEIPSGGCGVCGRIRGLGVSMYRRDDRSGGRVDQTITDDCLIHKAFQPSCWFYIPVNFQNIYLVTTKRDREGLASGLA